MAHFYIKSLNSHIWQLWLQHVSEYFSSVVIATVAHSCTIRTKMANMSKVIIQMRMVYSYLEALMKEHNAPTQPKQRSSVYGYHSCHLLSN